MKKESDGSERGQEEPLQGSLLLNIGKTVFLLVILIAAWFILEKLMGR